MFIYFCLYVIIIFFPLSVIYYNFHTHFPLQPGEALVTAKGIKLRTKFCK